ncbi:AfsA-related hotdog domain-containing protein [Actinoplanes sp. N902-109]|uniref:AfsA-related hotdog domain-containing protein n=1 Tax=Actinoplanes sp. (strain N902-109) TaxID=649831 RepID=UPI0005A07E92|nr:AfsA-related hotdog domain-containing protein [Actinoplanes sp. N902-109]
MTSTEHQPMIAVGDRFENFLANPGTVAASRVFDPAAGPDAGTPVVAGQGLSAEQLATLAGRTPADMPPPVPANAALTHKHQSRNVMIGVPADAGDGTYVAELILDERNEVIEDHLTGQHIPAVALIEAARQTWTAVTERFLRQDAAALRFVVTDIAASFQQLVFPLPTTLHYELIECVPGRMQQTYRCRVRVRQNGRTAAEIRGTYLTVAENLSAKQEALAARQAVARQIAAASAATARDRKDATS